MPNPRTLAPVASASLDDWLHYLENLHTKTIELGLERVSKVANALGVSQPTAPVITVAALMAKVQPFVIWKLFCSMLVIAPACMCLLIFITMPSGFV